MEKLKKEIEKQLKILNELIQQNKEKEVEKQRKLLDKLLNQYLKDI